MRRLLLLAWCALLLAPAGALGAVSQPDVEDEVMCVTCNVPLNIAESPQAERQKAIIRREIAKGRTKDQIEATLVDEYGADVLALPDKDGFGITAYAVPVALSLGLLLAVVFLLPRWRRSGNTSDTEEPHHQPLSPTESRRLDEDLDRYDA